MQKRYYNKRNKQIYNVGKFKSTEDKAIQCNLFDIQPTITDYIMDEERKILCAYLMYNPNKYF